ncbi:MAG: acyl-CoA thioesterase II [Xanthobacteraceae bacterium]|nr:MAG: acyl-CoA thioesterase II [Xanthobacteraceae bacterium]
MSAPLNLLSILDLETIEVNMFRGRSPQVGWQRIFGGEVIGQALVAACRTVEGRAPHSLHAYFILPGDPKVPIIFEVDRLRDGKSFTTRRVTAIQHGEAIFSMMVSFHREEPSDIEHQMPMPDVPGPDDLIGNEEMERKIMEVVPEPFRRYLQEERLLQLRPVEIERYFGKKLTDARCNIWFRVRTALPDDPAIHRCALAYASDMSILDAAMAAHGRTLFAKDIMAASLDHALWFHRPFRADDWLLYSQDSPTTGCSRGLGRGLIFARDGRLVASVAQEGMIRLRKEKT